MTATYFESTVKYEKVNEDGKAKKVTELYLIDAMSFSEIEERSCRQLSEIVQGDYLIQSLKRSKITEYIESNDENDDRLYKATVKITDSDNFGKEKESSIHYLVAASNINRALDNLEKSLSTFVIPYEIVKIEDTKFVEVIPYIPDDKERIPDNLKPQQ